MEVPTTTSYLNMVLNFAEHIGEFWETEAAILDGRVKTVAFNTSVFEKPSAKRPVTEQAAIDQPEFNEAFSQLPDWDAVLGVLPPLPDEPLSPVATLHNSNFSIQATAERIEGYSIVSETVTNNLDRLALQLNENCTLSELIHRSFIKIEGDNSFIRINFVSPPPINIPIEIKRSKQTDYSLVVNSTINLSALFVEPVTAVYKVIERSQNEFLLELTSASEGYI